jgi:hypothetical protein
MFGSADMSPEQHRALSSKGGVQSGVSRREKAERKAEIEDYMSTRFLAEECLGELKQYRRWLKRKRSMERKKAKREQSMSEAAENSDF